MASHSPLRFIVKLILFGGVLIAWLLYYGNLLHGNGVGSGSWLPSFDIGIPFKQAISQHPAQPHDEPSLIYRWQDSDGVWHFSDTSPEGVTHVERQELRPDTNLLQSIPSNKAAPPVSASPKTGLPSPTLLPGGALELLEQAKALGPALEQRFQAQQQAINGAR